MAWYSSIAEKLPKVLIFGFILYWIIRINSSITDRIALIVGGGLFVAFMLGRIFDRFGFPEWVLNVVLIAGLFAIWLATWTAVF